MQGIPKSIDWLRLTVDKRKLKGVGSYKQYGMAWQRQLDWMILNHSRCYFQLARGHDKTDRYAWWALLWLKTTNHGQAFCIGVDKDNARLFRDSMRWQVAAHPNLFATIKVQNYEVKCTSTGSVLRILASDEASNYGLTPDLLIINDFHAMQDRKFFEAVYTSMGKRKGNRIWLESNALSLGAAGTQWIRRFREGVREEAREEQEWPHRVMQKAKSRFEIHDKEYDEWRVPEWAFWAPKGFYATWQWREVKKWKKKIHPATYKRLVENEDVADGTQFLSQEQVTRCEKPRKDIPQEPIPGAKHLVSVDIGYSKDASVISVVSARRPSKLTRYKVDLGLALPRDVLRYTLHEQLVFTGTRDNPVNINKVVAVANGLAKKYHAEKIADPWGMRHVFTEDQTWQPFNMAAKTAREIAEILYEAFTNQQIDVPKDCGSAMQGDDQEPWTLKRELTEAVMKEMSYGSRVDHKADGYSDRLTSLGQALVQFNTEEFKPGKMPAPLQPRADRGHTAWLFEQMALDSQSTRQPLRII